MKFLIPIVVLLSLSQASLLMAKDFSSLVVCEDNEHLWLDITVPGLASFNPATDTLDLTSVTQRLVNVAFHNANPDEVFILEINAVDFEGDSEYYGEVGMYVNYEGSSSFPYQIEECIGQQYFSIDFILQDKTCEVPQIDTVRLTMSDHVANNTDVQIYTPENRLELEGSIPEKLQFEITDIDNNEIDVWMVLDDSTSAETRGFTLEIKDQTAGKISGYIHWDAICRLNNTQDTEEMRLGLVANELHSCEEGPPVIHWIDVQIHWPVNQPPTLKASKTLHEVFIGSRLSFSVTIEDYDENDTFIYIDGPEFGNSELQAQIDIVDVGSTKEVRLDWEPSCEAYLEGDSYHYSIWVQDDHCQKQRVDSLNVFIKLVEDRSSFDDFEPANVFTPNRDGINELFKMHGNLDSRRNLPSNTCSDRFERFSIYDASGLSVFESTERNFLWAAEGFNSGTYFYHIEYTSSQYKGFLTVIK